MKKYFTVLYAFLLYFAVTMITYLNSRPYSHKPWFISHNYSLSFLSGYSTGENIFWVVWILLSAFTVAMLLKSERNRDFFVKVLLFCVVYILMGHGDVFQQMFTWRVLGDYTFAYGVDFTRDDFLFFHYFGCILGTIAGFIITMMKKKQA